MDNKGQNFAHFKAVEAYLKTGTPLPCDLTFVIEGEEEVGSAKPREISQIESPRTGLQCRGRLRYRYASPNIPRWLFAAWHHRV